MPETADIADPASELTVVEPTRDEVFVRAIDLPTLSVRQAEAAVAQQLDILSPLPTAEVVFSVVLIGPVEEGLNRFAVGFAPRELLARLGAGRERSVTLTGWLDGEPVRFRFEPSGAAPGQPNWAARLEAATIAGLCLAILLVGATLRMGGEIDKLQARADDANAEALRLGAEAASVDRLAVAWRAAAAARGAGVVDCALGGLAKAANGSVSIARLGFADGVVTAHLSAPPSDATLTALRALGFSATPPAAPGGPSMPAAAADPAASPVVRDVQTTAADCR